MRLCLQCGALPPENDGKCPGCGAPPETDERLRTAFSEPDLCPDRLHQLSVDLQTRLASSDDPAETRRSFLTDHAPADDPSSGDEEATADLIQETPPECDPALVEAFERLSHPRTGWASGLSLLILSIALFFLAGLADLSPRSIVMIVLIILFHELGHYAGMKIFGYRNVRMFFIPFLGAAVAGVNTSTKGWKKGVVSLAGPLPGLLLGYALLVASLFTGPDRTIPLRETAAFLILLNGFNLAPFLPLDGGQLLQTILFCRLPIFEAVARVTAGIALLAGAVILQAFFLGLIGVFVFLSTPALLKAAQLARRLRTQFPLPDDEVSLDRIPPDQFPILAAEIQTAFPSVTDPAARAGLLRQVWERMQEKPPGLAGSLLLFYAWLGALLSLIPAGIAFIVTAPQV